MMKAFCSFVIFGVLFAVCMADFTPEQQSKIDECKQSTQATEDDIKSILEYQMPQTHTGKCFLSCSQEKLGVIVDGKFSVDGSKAIGAKKYEGNEKSIGIYNEMVAECESISDPDTCELGAKIMDCMVNAAVKRGIDLKQGIQK